ncbi:MAG: DUF1592 domain-containing protein [Myxococcales bacterium]|nr:DUF1592 domain-containing protein [Myxococcales bacterium]
MSAAFGGPQPGVELPPDGSDGVFTTNAGSEGIGDYHGYVVASEAFGAHFAPALATACDWSSDLQGCTVSVFEPVLFELYRGADEPADYSELAELIGTALDEGATLEVALTGGVSRALLDERFLFHIEYGGEAGSEPDALLLTGLELASRLSYVLVDAPPDADLRATALAGLERDPAAIRAVAATLFDDARSRDEVWRFAREWLGITEPPPDAPPTPIDECDFTAECIELHGPTANDCVNSQSSQSWCQCGDTRCVPVETGMGLNQAMFEETRRFVEHIVFDSDAPLTELFTADYSFIDANLAAHYGVPAPATDWEQYEFPPEAKRRGVLTHASFLSSNGAEIRDASWIFRGKVVYESLLCGELAPPPPGVIDREVENRETTAPCDACHKIMDPIGRIFDGYDEHGVLVDDASFDARVDVGSTLDGSYDGAVDFTSAYGASDELAECFATMWFRHALARRPVAADEPSLAPIRDVVASSGSVRSAALELMAAPAFRTLYLSPEDQVCP